MEDSILNSVKKLCGVDPSYEAFDLDILMHINTTFASLNQLGIGPPEGFMIDDNTHVWSDFIGLDSRLNSVKTYVVLKVRLLFDPPATSYAIQAMTEQIKELEWRLNTYRESTQWINPSEDPAEVLVETTVIDGGTG